MYDADSVSMCRYAFPYGCAPDTTIKIHYYKSELLMTLERIPSRDFRSLLRPTATSFLFRQLASRYTKSHVDPWSQSAFRFEGDFKT
jgi:hypothetical protein